LEMEFKPGNVKLTPKILKILRILFKIQ
jgi:hypothetical protein